VPGPRPPDRAAAGHRQPTPMYRSWHPPQRTADTERRERRHDRARHGVAALPHPLAEKLTSATQVLEADAAHTWFERMTRSLREKLPSVAEYFEDARQDFLALPTCP
jgi:hypothetical protein